MKNKPTYENSLQELQSILEKLESEVIGIDDLSKEIQRASELILWCKNKLKQTENSIDDSFKEINI